MWRTEQNTINIIKTYNGKEHQETNGDQNRKYFNRGGNRFKGIFSDFF